MDNMDNMDQHQRRGWMPTFYPGKVGILDRILNWLGDLVCGKKS